MTKLAGFCSATAILFCGIATIAGAQDSRDYPEISIDKSLPAIAAALRDTLIDPNSVTNFIACPVPVKVKFRDGKPAWWTFEISLNSKNRDGGYEGATGFSAVVSGSQVINLFNNKYPLSAFMSPEKIATCKRIPDAEIQRLIQADGQ